jgi:hypothetical protein
LCTFNLFLVNPFSNEHLSLVQIGLSKCLSISVMKKDKKIYNVHEGKISMEQEVNKEKLSFCCCLYNTVPRQYYCKQYRHSLYLPQREINDIAKNMVMFFILFLRSVEVDLRNRQDYFLNHRERDLYRVQARKRFLPHRMVPVYFLLFTQDVSHPAKA